MSVIGGNRVAIGQDPIPIYGIMPSGYVGDFIFYTPHHKVLKWVTLSNYTGYQSADCGQLSFGTSVGVDSADRAFIAVGQTLLKADYLPFYSKMARELKLVTLSAWVPLAFQICDVSTTQFRAPDLRDQFPRFYGASRALGSSQTGMSQINPGVMVRVGDFGGTDGQLDFNGISTTANVNDMSPAPFHSPNLTTMYPETRPVNTAFVPLIQR